MDKKPSLQEFLRKHPGKGLNDYYKKYGDPASVPPPSVDKPRSYITRPKREKSKVNFLSVVASVLLLAGFFLPWLDVSLLQGQEAGASSFASGWDMQKVYSRLSLPQFSATSHLTSYLIPVGAVVALFGELLRHWPSRSIGQVLGLSFSAYWLYKLYVLLIKSDYAPTEPAWDSLLQYGFIPLGLGMVYYFIDILWTLAGKR